MNEFPSFDYRQSEMIEGKNFIFIFLEWLGGRDAVFGVGSARAPPAPFSTLAIWGCWRVVLGRAVIMVVSENFFRTSGSSYSTLKTIFWNFQSCIKEWGGKLFPLFMVSLGFSRSGFPFPVLSRPVRLDYVELWGKNRIFWSLFEDFCQYLENELLFFFDAMCAL